MKLYILLTLMCIFVVKANSFITVRVNVTTGDPPTTTSTSGLQGLLEIPRLIHETLRNTVSQVIGGLFSTTTAVPLTTAAPPSTRSPQQTQSVSRTYIKAPQQPVRRTKSRPQQAAQPVRRTNPSPPKPAQFARKINTRPSQLASAGRTTSTTRSPPSYVYMRSNGRKTPSRRNNQL